MSKMYATMLTTEYELRTRVEILEEENRQLRGMMRPKMQFTPEWGLSRQQSQLLALIYSRAMASYEQIEVALDIARGEDGGGHETHVKVVAHNVRKKLAPFNIDFHTVHGTGYAMDSENKARVRAGIITPDL